MPFRCPYAVLQPSNSLHNPSRIALSDPTREKNRCKQRVRGHGFFQHNHAHTDTDGLTQRTQRRLQTKPPSSPNAFLTSVLAVRLLAAGVGADLKLPLAVVVAVALTSLLDLLSCDGFTGTGTTG